MFRRLSIRNSFNAKPKEFVRTKIIKPATLLNTSEKIKQWNQESKQLFGPLLETSKQRKQRLKKSDNTNTGPEEESLEVSANEKDSNTKVKMMNNMNYCTRLLSLINVSPARSFSTSAGNKAVSSKIQSGYHSEDRILQIKPHKNDYAEQYPSVTLILNKTMTDDSRSALEKWKKERIAELGPEEFNRFYQAQMAVGTKFHSTLKDYFTQPRTKLQIEKDVEGVWNSVGEVLKSISSPKAIESNVVHPVLKYRGIFDAIADYEEKPTLIEWKKSDKPRKSISLTYDNPVQLAAYFGAVCNDLNYKDFNVRDALLVIAYTDGSKADAYHLSTDKLREHWAQWLIRLEQYVVKYGKDSQKILKGGKRLFEEDIGNLS